MVKGRWVGERATLRVSVVVARRGEPSDDREHQGADRRKWSRPIVGSPRRTIQRRGEHHGCGEHLDAGSIRTFALKRSRGICLGCLMIIVLNSSASTRSVFSSAFEDAGASCAMPPASSPLPMLCAPAGVTRSSASEKEEALHCNRILS